MTNILTGVLSATQIDCLERFADRITNVHANLIVFDPDGNCLLSYPSGDFESAPAQFGEYVRNMCRQQSEQVEEFGDCGEILVICLKAADAIVAAAVLDSSDLGFGNNEDLRRLCGRYNIDYELVAEAVRAGSRDRDYFRQMLISFAEEFKSSSRAAQQLEIVSAELTQTYQELMLLYNMGANMKLTQSNATYLQMACDQITRSVNVEGIAIFIERKIENEKRLVLTAGSGVVVIDQVMADILQDRLTLELNEGKEALLDSRVDSPFKYEWSDRVRNIIAVSLYGNDRMIGLMVATNIIDKPDFDNIDVKLFNSVANQCAVFIENGGLFKDLKELFIGSLKTLTNSIDAKDQYTRGHSDRVAFISRWISERFAEHQPLEEEEIHKIYLAGLLHDVGKIGIDEAVLRKKGRLNEKEMSQIKAHPRMGAAILADIRQMAGIMPGILYHHERIDGKGYPEGLSGDDIPLMGKIIGLADAFDAMTSKRAYRDAMSLKRAKAEIEKNMGSQFDEVIGRIFLESDINKLWSIIQDGFIESWDYSNFSEYGTTAVGTLLR